MTAPGLEFGVFDHLDRNDLSLAEYYEQRLQVIEAFDRTGFYGYHVAEHHFTPLGMAPSPSVFLAAAAQRTRRLRLGTFVYALPLHHPLRVMEEICMLDHLSGGRVEIGFGRGSVPYEISYYGQNAAERQQIYEERLDLILQAFGSKRFSFHGKYDQFDNVPLQMEPLQKPHPPLWYGAHSPDSAARAARRGMHMVNNDIPATTRATVARFREVWRELHGSAVPLPKMGMVRFIVVSDDDAAALAAARRAYARWLTSFNYLHVMHGTQPLLGARPENFDLLMQKGLGIAGAPGKVLKFLGDQLQDCGTNYIVGQFAFGDLTLAEMLRSVTLFAAEVMPPLRARMQASAAAQAR
ncbi:MAG TPA: LLM class flavin-dependent oxidoreductase [Xanthobacteraceae bacterium]|nr:LLM class flavin-dependent oxidoreductase [Xanthobacteraceae bacterium]